MLISRSFITFDILIPAYNEAKNIMATLLALKECKRLHPSMGNIIIVISGDDGTKEICDSFKEDYFKIVYTEGRQGKSSAINDGVNMSKADIICILDADISFPASIFNCLVAFTDETLGCIGVRVVPAFHNTFLNYVSQSHWYLHDIFNRVSNQNGSYIHPTDFIAIRRRLFKPLPEHIINDDTYIGAKIEEMGFRTIYLPLYAVFIEAPKTFTEMVRQKRRWYLGHRQLAQYNVKTPNTIKVTTALKIYFTTLASILVLPIIEVMGRLLSMARSVPRTNHEVCENWKMISTTKQLAEYLY